MNLSVIKKAIKKAEKNGWRYEDYLVIIIAMAGIIYFWGFV